MLDSLFGPAGLSGQSVVWVVTGLVGLLLIVIILLLGDDSSANMKRRVKRVQNAKGRRPTAMEKVVSVRRSDADSEIAVIDLLIKKVLPRPDILRHLIARAGLKINVGTYLMICLGTFAVVAVGMLFVPDVPMVAAPMVGIFAGIGLPYMVINFLGNRRKGKFIQNFPEAIDLMVRGLKSGLPISESIKVAAEEIPDPVGCEMQSITDNVRMGKKMEDAMLETGNRLNIQEFNFMTVAMSIQSETGGNLAETLTNLSDVLRKRRMLKLKIKALSSEAKTSAYIIGSLPFIMAVLIHLTNEHYLVPLWTDPRGHLAVMGGLLWFAMGAGVMYKMVRFEV
jgi:tight adherence protein B